MKYGEEFTAAGRTLVFVGMGDEQNPLDEKWGENLWMLSTDESKWIGGPFGACEKIEYYVEESVFDEMG